MSREDTHMLDVHWMAAEWVSYQKKFQGKTIAYIDVSYLEFEDRKTTVVGDSRTSSELQGKEIQVGVVYAPHHKDRRTKLNVVLSPQKTTEITVFRGGVRGLDECIQLHFDEYTDYSLNCWEDFYEKREQLRQIRVRDVEIPDRMFNKNHAHAIVTPIQQHSSKTFVKKLKLKGKVEIRFTDMKQVSVNIGDIVSDLKNLYRRNQPSDLSMVSVSRSKSVKWEMELKVEQKWEVDARVTFPNLKK
ncbi:uncharacterized protein LOC131935824 [Physella acuta]|uniref:uncharacterized protein LOC131935824 n=1 Tax=Physella acuta TaxID=109671 RepID=UPI0027DBD9C7|nr:uncharacterized protein LOC131935824 [Physella acuta]XP_059148475.1 uncharacterized protein LOC131935824 [Physella acuta]